MEDITYETVVSNTGTFRAKSCLVSIRAVPFCELPHSFVVLEGMIRLRVGERPILSEELVGFGSIDDYWREVIHFIEELSSLRPAAWSLPGKRCLVVCEFTPGARRGLLKLTCRGIDMATAPVHVPTLVEALLDGAEEYFRWLKEGRRFGALEQIAQLRALPAPWRNS